MARAAPWGGLAVALSLLAAAASAAAATVHEAPVGGRLAAGGAGPATGGAAPAAATIRAYLGRVEPDVAGASLKVVRVTPSLSGVTHVVQEQLGPDGARIVGAYAKAALRDNGDLLRVAHTLAPTAEVAAAAAAAPAAAAAGGAGGEASAVAAALAYLGLAADTPWWKPPVAERVWLRVGANGAASDEGELAPGFEVRTWTAATNQLHYTYVAHGAVVGDRCATSGDSYRVYRYSPIRGGARVVKGPAKTGNGPSPDGWLSPGKMTTQDISGNNVHAYLDTNDDDEPDTDPALNATAVANGVFNAVATPSSGNPNTTNNRNAAVQNLFYQVNLAHDAAYRAGFVEAAGNFQDDNYGRFGAAGDAVDAQAQDGGGVNNANMATPDQDGEAPRMQMYLFNMDQGAYAEAENKTYSGFGAMFGPPLTVAGVTARARPIVSLPVKGVDGSPGEGCTAAAPRSLVGVIAVVARGNCTFVTKVLNAQAAGAVGVLVVNYATGPPSNGMAGATNETISIPSLIVEFESGEALRAAAARDAPVKLAVTRPQTGQIDGSFDSDIVLHEYVSPPPSTRAAGRRVAARGCWPCHRVAARTPTTHRARVQAHGITARMVGYTIRPPTAGSFNEGASGAHARARATPRHDTPPLPISSSALPRITRAAHTPPRHARSPRRAADVFAFLLNGDDRMARYANAALIIGSAVNDGDTPPRRAPRPVLPRAAVPPADPAPAARAALRPPGIRRYRYRGYPLTYRNLTGINTEVHNGGEIYAAAMWRLKELYDDAGLSTTGPSTNNVLLQDWIQGLAYIVRDPTLEDARNGLLAHLKYYHPERVCLAWAAFAQFGIGVGAKAVDTADVRFDPNRDDAKDLIWVIVIGESFALPDECAGARGAAARAAPGPPPEPNAVTWPVLAARGVAETA
ncbi:MEP5 [Scenedesmus sp. PABB004]|nr:MEP5 [Scenedesmus sp. PABB004]